MMNCSLIICTYNWPRALDLVLKSVALQSELPNEIIIADDGSSEETFNVIESYYKKISIPIVHSWQEDLGCRIPHSRNRAIAKSSFEYIIVIDGDTVLHHEFIKNHNSKFANYKILYGGSVKANNAKEIVSLSNVDGALIGGESLKADDLTKIIAD